MAQSSSGKIGGYWSEQVKEKLRIMRPQFFVDIKKDTPMHYTYIEADNRSRHKYYII